MRTRLDPLIEAAGSMQEAGKALKFCTRKKSARTTVGRAPLSNVRLLVLQVLQV